jgi:serine protease Do
MKSNTMAMNAIRYMIVSTLMLLTLLALIPQDVFGAGKYESTFDSPFVSVAERLKPAVVYITVVKEQNISSQIPYGFRQFFEMEPNPNEPRTRRVPSSGSGLIIDKDGYILTNNHVVSNATKITVKLVDGSEVNAEIIGTDPDTDLALIKVGKVKSEYVAPLGDSDAMRIGDWAIAMGSPLGLEWTLTVGVISAKGRSNLRIAGGGPVFQDFIQTDASINFGNSGGPLANIKGEVIGINSAINASAENIGFAIPINMAKEVVRQLREGGIVQRGYLGMMPTRLTALLREALAVGDDIKGVFVESVSANTPADEGGLKASDVVIEVDGKKVLDVNDFRFRVAAHAPGDDMDLTILREGKESRLNFILGNRADALNQPRTRVEVDEDWMGLKVAPLNSRMTQRMNIEVEEGVVVVSVDQDSPSEGKLRAGDVIVEVGQEAVKDINDWREVIGNLSDSDKAVLVIYHPGGRSATRIIALKQE